MKIFTPETRLRKWWSLRKNGVVSEWHVQYWKYNTCGWMYSWFIFLVGLMSTFQLIRWTNSHLVILGRISTVHLTSALVNCRLISKKEYQPVCYGPRTELLLSMWCKSGSKIMEAARFILHGINIHTLYAKYEKCS